MTKKDILDGIKKYKKKNRLKELPFEDMFDYWQSLAEFFGKDSPLGFEAIREDGNSFVIATYWVSSIQKSVILDWDATCMFDFEDELVDYIIELFDEGNEVENRLMANK